MASGKWRVIASLLLSLGPGLACAHEHWIDVDNFRPASNTNVAVRICSGHYFPKSSFGLKDEVLARVEMLTPDKATVPVATTRTEKQRTGTATVSRPGVHLLRCVLKRPRAKQPSYEAKTILVAGDSADQPTQYAANRGLELVPLRALTALKTGDELPVTLLLDGQRIAGSIEASVAGGKTSFLKTEVDSPGVLRLRKPGRYLLTANAKGRGCSLVFQIATSAGERP